MNRSFRNYVQLREGQYWGSEGAGILAIASDTGKWLVAHRSPRVKQPNTWGVVGGKIDPHELPSAAARREFREETGYPGHVNTVEIYKWIAPEKLSDGTTPKFVYYNFLGEIVKGDWEPVKNFETSEFRWCSYEELVALEPKHFGLAALLDNKSDIIREVSLRHQQR